MLVRPAPFVSYFDFSTAFPQDVNDTSLEAGSDCFRIDEKLWDWQAAQREPLLALRRFDGGPVGCDAVRQRVRAHDLGTWDR